MIVSPPRMNGLALVVLAVACLAGRAVALNFECYPLGVKLDAIRGMQLNSTLSPKDWDEALLRMRLIPDTFCYSDAEKKAGTTRAQSETEAFANVAPATAQCKRALRHVAIAHSLGPCLGFEDWAVLKPETLDFEAIVGAYLQNPIGELGGVLKRKGIDPKKALPSREDCNRATSIVYELLRSEKLADEPASCKSLQAVFSSAEPAHNNQTAIAMAILLLLYSVI